MPLHLVEETGIEPMYTGSKPVALPLCDSSLYAACWLSFTFSKRQNGVLYGCQDINHNLII